MIVFSQIQKLIVWIKKYELELNSQMYSPGLEEGEGEGTRAVTFWIGVYWVFLVRKV